MGIIRPSTSSEFRFSNAGSELKIVSNSSDGAIGFEHNASGIPFVRTDSSFSGDHSETIDNAGALELVQYEGWDDTVSEDSATSLDDTTSWADTDGGEVVIDYVLQLAGLAGESSPHYFDGVGEYISQPYSVGACRRVYNDSVTKTETIPTGTVLNTDVAVSYDGGVSYEDWQPLNGAIFNQGEVLEDVFVKYRIRLEATSDGATTPALSQWEHALNSYTVMKIEATGEIRYANSDYTNYSEVI